jgi:hypothetical protein
MDACSSLRTMAHRGVHPAESAHSLSADRSVLCWGGGVHNVFTMLSVSLLSWHIRCPSSQFPTSLPITTTLWLSGRGIQFVDRVRFISARMDHDQFAFGFWYQLRNFAPALTPVILSTNFSLQVIGFAFVSLVWLVAQMHYLPW